MSYLLLGLIVVVQGIAAFLYFAAYREEKKKNLLASGIVAVVTILAACITQVITDQKAYQARQLADQQVASLQLAIETDGSKTRTLQQELARLQKELDKRQTVQIGQATNSPMMNTNGSVSAGGSIIVGTVEQLTTSAEVAPLVNEKDEVSGLTTSKATVRKGQRVRLIASGSISIGPLAGTSTPEGRPSGLLGTYSLNSSFNHGALLYRIGETMPWQYCGSGDEFTAPQSGRLQFQVNDAQQENNSGAYRVTTQIFAK